MKVNKLIELAQKVLEEHGNIECALTIKGKFLSGQLIDQSQIFVDKNFHNPKKYTLFIEYKCGNVI